MLIDKSAIEVSKPKKDLDVSNRLWLGLILNGLDPSRIYRHAIAANRKTKEVDTVLVELVLR